MLCLSEIIVQQVCDCAEQHGHVPANKHVRRRRSSGTICLWQSVVIVAGFISHGICTWRISQPAMLNTVFQPVSRVSQGDDAVWSVMFNFVSLQHSNLFAAVAGNKVSCEGERTCRATRMIAQTHSLLRNRPFASVQACIYRCEPGGGITLVQAYVDDNVRHMHVALHRLTRLPCCIKKRFERPRQHV